MVLEPSGGQVLALPEIVDVVAGPWVTWVGTSTPPGRQAWFGGTSARVASGLLRSSRGPTS